MDQRRPRWLWLWVTPRNRTSAAVNLVAVPVMTIWLVTQFARGRYASSVMPLLVTTVMWVGVPASWQVLVRGNDRIPRGSAAARELRRQVGVLLVFFGLLLGLLLVGALVV